MKTSNIILTVFGIILVIALIAKDLSSTKRVECDSKNAVYKTLEITKKQTVNHLMLNGFRQEVIYQISQGTELKIEVIDSEYSKDSCKYNFSNDSLFVNVTNPEHYSYLFDIPTVKITAPKLLSINVFKVYCNIVGMELDTLQIRSIYDFAGITMAKCKLNMLNFTGKNSNLSIDSTNNVNHLVFNSIGSFANLNLDGAIINQLDFNADSASVKLSGKSIAKYLK